MNPKVDGVVYDLIGEINAWYAALDKTGKTAQELETLKLEKIANRRADFIDVILGSRPIESAKQRSRSARVGCMTILSLWTQTSLI